MSFLRQRGTEGSGWQPSAVSEAAMDTPDACGCTQHTTGGLGHQQPDSGGWRYPRRVPAKPAP